jgi:hypothetical protein
MSPETAGGFTGPGSVGSGVGAGVGAGPGAARLGGAVAGRGVGFTPWLAQAASSKTSARGAIRRSTTPLLVSVESGFNAARTGAVVG